LCGYPMRRLTYSGDYYCINESCTVQFVKVISKEQWVERRNTIGARRRAQLEKAIRGGPVSLVVPSD